MLASNVAAAHPLVVTLQRWTELSPAEVSALSALPCEIVSYPAGEAILRGGDHVSHMLVVLEGLVCTSREVVSGKRQITSLLIPGDLPVQMMDPESEADLDVLSIGTCRLALLDSPQVYAVCVQFPKISWVLWERALLSVSIQREWLLNMSHAPALQRLAHFLCETMARFEAAGLASSSRCNLPLTQSHLSEITGVHRVQVNRCLQELRRLGLITFEGGQLTIHDRTALAEVGRFSPGYLRQPKSAWRTP